MGQTKTDPKGVTILRWTAWALLLVWAAFWIFFNVASGIAEIAEPGALVWHLILTVVILVALYVAWRWELVGGILLIVLAGLTFYQWGWHQPYGVAVFLCLPLFVIGVLLILCWWLARQRKNAPVKTDGGTSSDSSSSSSSTT